MAEPVLPELFGDMAPFLDWALEPERARTEKMSSASMDEILSFYNAMMPRIGEILDYLQDHFDGYQDGNGGKLEPGYHLYLMSLSLVEIAILAELYKRREAVSSCDPLRFVLQP